MWYIVKIYAGEDGRVRAAVKDALADRQEAEAVVAAIPAAKNVYHYIMPIERLVELKSRRIVFDE